MELSISLLEVGLDRSVPESRIWRWDRGYSTAEQSPPARFAVHCAVCHQRIIITPREIPCTFKLGSICPVYKGGGKDPFLATNYRGITMNSVFSKVLETLILSRLESTHSDAGFPHLKVRGYSLLINYS